MKKMKEKKRTEGRKEKCSFLFLPLFFYFFSTLIFFKILNYFLNSKTYSDPGYFKLRPSTNFKSRGHSLFTHTAISDYVRMKINFPNVENIDRHSVVKLMDKTSQQSPTFKKFVSQKQPDRFLNLSYTYFLKTGSIYHEIRNTFRFQTAVKIVKTLFSEYAQLYKILIV